MCLFGTFQGAFWTIQSGSGPEFYKEFDFEVKKIGLRSEKFILKEFAGKFGTHFLLFIIFFFFIFSGGVGYKIDAPIWEKLKLEVCAMYRDGDGGCWSVWETYAKSRLW